MLSCNEICKALSSFEGEQIYKFEHYNPLFEQSHDFSKKYLQLVEDKIKENGWIDPNLQPILFKKEIIPMKEEREREREKDKEKEKYSEKDKEKDKDKDSEKDVEDKDRENKDGLNYKEHQTNDLPMQFYNLINESRRNELYYYGMKGPDSFLASVLLGAEPNYWLQHRKKKKDYADQIKTTFCIQKYDIMRGLSKESMGTAFTNKIFSNDFPEHIDSDVSKEFQFLIGLHFKVNVLVLELKTLKGYFATDWKPDINTLVLMLDPNTNTYFPILSNKISYFNSEEVKELEKGFNILYPVMIEVEETKSKGKGKNKSDGTMITSAEQIDIKRIKVEHIQTIAKYQLKDLQDIAEKLNLETEYQKPSSDGKITKTIRKTKKELYDDIIQKITSLGN
jgi:hypothetical protein